MEFTEFIKAELLILIPVLYAIGLFIKNVEKIKDNYIPIILTVISLLLSSLYVIANEGITLMSIFTAIIQGVLCAAAAVYTNQLIKQSTTK